MRSRSIVLTAFLSIAGVSPAMANDVVGKWFSQTGDQIITIYKAGPEYAAAIPVTQGTNSVGTFYETLSAFSVAGTHVHFQVQSDQNVPNGHLQQGTVYDLDLSPEGQRLVGTLQNYGSFQNNSGPVTLFLRN